MRTNRVLGVGIASKLVGVLAALALALSACGELPEESSVRKVGLDGSVQAAIVNTMAGSGRYQLVIDTEDDVEVGIAGEFAGADYREEMTVEGYTTVSLFVDGLGYASIEEFMLEMMGYVSGEDPDASEIEWIELGILSDFMGSPVDEGVFGIAKVEEMFGTLEQVTESPSEEIDGIDTTHMSGTISGSSLLEAVEAQQEEQLESVRDIFDQTLPAGEEIPEEMFDLVFGGSLTDEEREALYSYADEHIDVGAEAWVDEAGLVHRLKVTIESEIEDQYQGCPQFVSLSDMTLTLDYFDLGEKISIDAPDPSTIADFGDLLATEGELPDFEGELPDFEGELPDFEGELPDEFFEGFDEFAEELDDFGEEFPEDIFGDLEDLAGDFDFENPMDLFEGLVTCPS